jgi:hypothetical protein
LSEVARQNRNRGEKTAVRRNAPFFPPRSKFATSNTMLLLATSAAQGYGSLEGHEASAAVEGACARCSSRLGHALGDPWTSCVVEELLTEQDEAKQAGRPYFPMVPHAFQPLAPERGGYGQADLFKNLLRNCTCSFDDGGSPPLRR